MHIQDPIIDEDYIAIMNYHPLQEEIERLEKEVRNLEDKIYRMNNRILDLYSEQWEQDPEAY